MRSPAHFRTLLLGVSLALAASAGNALADDTTPPQTTTPSTGDTTTTTPQTSDNSAQSTPADKNVDEQIVCRKEPALTGSRVGARKVCRTVREWRELQSKARDTVTGIQSKGGTDNPSGL